MLPKLAFWLLLCSVALTSAYTYEGYKIYDVNGKNDFEKSVLFRLSESDKYDFFALPKLLGVPARVMVQPQHQDKFEFTLRLFGLQFSVVNSNVGESVRLESEQNAFLDSAFNESRLGFNKFYRFGEINDYLDHLARKFPKTATVKTFGKSYQNRDLKTITITNGDGVANKSMIFIDGGIHAREWIGPATILYIINQLLFASVSNADLLKKLDWIILPVVNPDGYEFTHSYFRFWRKTRKPGLNCYGTDGNRNFDFHWGEAGSSESECSDTFRGEKAFSEPETQVVRDIMLSISGRAKMYLSMHSYGSYLLYPWGYTTDLPKNWKDLDEVARAGADAIQAIRHVNYTVGSINNLLYASAGGSGDYALAKANIPIVIVMELPGGGSGFDPPPTQILNFAEEAWVGVKAMAHKILKKYSKV